MNKKVVLITGGNGLLGKSHAYTFLNNNYNVILSDISHKKILKDFDYIKLDVTIQEDWENAMNYIINNYGKIDVLINNAATTNNTNSENYNNDFLETNFSQWNNILDVNLNGVFLGCQNACKQMKKQGFGSIINVGSIYGVVSPNHNIYANTEIKQPIAYSVSKAGVISLTKFLATLMIKHNIRINCISPGGVWDNQDEKFIETYSKLAPIGRLATTSEISNAIYFLASNEASNIVGHNLMVDGGWTVW